MKATVALLLSLIFCQLSASAANFTTAVQQGTSGRWDAAIWNPGPVAPTAGNTYQAIAGGNPTRLRNPASGSGDAVIGVKTFPGDSLQLDAATEIRAKGVGNTIDFPGLGGNPGLIMNGGNLDTGDNGLFTVSGVMLVQANSSFTCGDSAANNTRGWRVSAQITGSARLTVAKWAIGGIPAVDLTSVNNPFTGTWFVTSGKFLASGSGSLGNASVTISPTNAAINPAPFEVNYDVNSSGTLILTNGGQMILHQNCIFSAVIINGTPLATGLHPYSELVANFPNNFATGGSGSITVQPPAPPAAPQNVVAVSGDSQVRLSWSAPANATGFLVMGSTTSGGPYSTIADTTSTSYTNTGLLNGTTIYYVIQATNVLGASPNSAEVIGHPNPVVSGLTAVGGTGQVALAWSGLSSGAGADSYNISRSTNSSGPFGSVATSVVGLSYIDTTVQNGTTYFYIVTGNLTGGGTSNPSEVASASTAPSAPALSVTLYAETAANLSWTLSEAAVSRFLIERSSDNGDTYTEIATVAGTARTYRAVGLESLTAYLFRVRGTNTGGFSPYSDAASITTPAFGLHVNFAAGAGNSAGNPVAPVPAGYFQDIGELYGDRGVGFNYGWDRNIVTDGRYRQNTNSPDLRYDTFMHLIKATPPAIWNIAVPNGIYEVHIVSGDPTATDSIFQFDVEGVITDTITANTPAAFSNFWADFRVGCTVTDGQLTIKSGPNSQTTVNNNKINFIDITTPLPVVIATQPQSQTIEEGRRFTMSVTLSAGSPPVTYRWYRNGSPIPNGTNRVYKVDFAFIDQDSGTYYVEVTNPLGTVPSNTADLIINPDETPPTIVSASSLDGSKIKVVWSEVIDPNTGSDPASYKISGGATIVGLPQLVADEFGDLRIVLISVSGLTTSTFDIGVNDGFIIYDPFGNPQTTYPLASGKVFALGSGLTDDGPVGTATDPAEKGSTAIEVNQLTVVAGGSDIWNNADGFRYAYGSYTGDFDLKVRVTGLSPRNRWSKAGIVVREDLAPGAHNLSAVITPAAAVALDGSGATTADYEAGNRATLGGATTDWARFRPTNGPPNVDAWLRLRRQGNTFAAYYLTNGLWVNFAITNQTFPTTVLAGLGTTAHNNGAGQTTTAVYQDFKKILPPQITTQPQTHTVNQGENTSFTVAATGDGAPYSYQWRKNGVNINGATTDTLTLNSVTGNDDAEYDVLVLDLNSFTSSLSAHLFVRTPPSISTHPQSQTVGCGSVTFNVAAAGSPPLTYQWRKGTMDIMGANGISYTISSVQAGDAGSYSVVVSNDLNIAISDAAVLTVADIVKPVITCPANITTPCTGTSGATVNFTVTATDNCDPNPVVNCVPPSGSTFARGTTTVNCTATDASNNSQNCSFTVTVQDNVSPVLTIVQNNNQVTISWPQSNCTVFHLEEKDALDLPTWSDLGAGQASGGNYQVTVPVGTGSKFFRLKSQP